MKKSSEGVASRPEDLQHIALFLPNFDGGGAERAFVNLARGIAELGHRVDMVVGQASGPLRAEVSPLVRVVDLAAPRLAFALPGLVRYLRSERPDRVYSALEEAGILVLLARKLSGAAPKVIPSIRNTLSDEARLSSPKRRFLLRLARWLYPTADAVVAVSNGVAKDAAKILHLPLSSIRVIRNPTLTPELRLSAMEPVDHAWFVPKSVPIILGCGRLAPQKDFSTLIEAFALIRARRPCRLVILGDGPLRDVLARLAEARGVAEDVAMPGFDPNPYRYMRRCDVFVLSSLFEGSPNVLVQALACGAPVVSTDCPSGPDELLEGVARGKLVPVGNVRAMADAIKCFLDGSAAGPAVVDLDGFDYLDAARNYLDVLSPETAIAAQTFAAGSHGKRGRWQNGA
jgi:glycosyltransferase involved in cell wall biosynthesis